MGDEEVIGVEVLIEFGECVGWICGEVEFGDDFFEWRGDE